MAKQLLKIGNAVSEINVEDGNPIIQVGETKISSDGKLGGIIYKNITELKEAGKTWYDEEHEVTCFKLNAGESVIIRNDDIGTILGEGETLELDIDKYEFMTVEPEVLMPTSFIENFAWWRQYMLDGFLSSIEYHPLETSEMYVNDGYISCQNIDADTNPSIMIKKDFNNTYTIYPVTGLLY